MIRTGTMAKRKRSEHYVNNKEFLAALIRYREDVEIAKLQDKPKPVIPRYIGDCFLKIANHLSFKPNFVNYMFKEDMISMESKIAFNTYTILILRNPRTLLTLRRLYIMHFSAEYKERKTT